MKSALRAIIFTYISVYITQFITLSISFYSDSTNNFHLFILGLSAIYFFSKPILRILSLPHRGIGNMFLNFVLTFCFMYILMTFVPLISVSKAIIPNLKLFGFMLPSKVLNGVMAVAFVSLLISLIYSFFDWLCTNKR